MDYGAVLSICSCILAAASPISASTPVPSDEEIVVIARKMRQIEVDMKLGRKNGEVSLKTCRVTRGSGRPELDGIPCQVARQCVAEGVTDRKALVRCVEDRSNARADAILAAWRSGAKWERPAEKP